MGSLLNPYTFHTIYDVLNNLLTVNQGVQTRSFQYDSLSRLKQAANPESGTINYLYDDNSNLTGKTDARTITTSYVYDNLNRITTRTYSDTITPAVSYFYDNLTNAKGKLIKVENLYSKTEYQTFDTLGRVLQSRQTTDGTVYDPMTYTYNLSGAMVEQKYPSGRVVRNVLDNDGDLSIVQSKKSANAGYFNYADSFTYSAAGTVSSMQLGNGKWESTSFNSRLQPTQIALGTVQSGTDKLKLNFNYGGTVNNGNVLSQTITVPTTGAANGFTAVQNYSYDSLNRLKSATETIGTTQTWKQTFTFDRYGNRNFDTANTTTIPTGCAVAICNPQVDPATNKLIGYQFDNSGNTKVDAANRQFNYDGENKQVEVKDQYGTSIGKYVFDGDGKRVKKISNTETTIFVYNASGQLVAEYSTLPNPTPQVSYLTSDHLGSPRITTDKDGKVFSRRDFLPFGEEIQSGSGGRTTAQGYGGQDSVRQKFTGYERDNETELDFAQARMHSYTLGRFTSPDDYLNDTHPAAPQSWNLYVYVRNNPLKYIDPMGKEIWISFQEEEEYEEDGEKKKRTVTRRVQYRNGALLNEDGSEYAGSNQYALNARDYLNALSQDPVLGTMINQMDRSRRIHTIMRDPNDPDNNEVVPTSKTPRSGTIIYWSGEDSVIRERVGNSTTLVDVTRSALFTLAHEVLGHAWFVDQGRLRNVWLQDLGVNARYVNCNINERCLEHTLFNQAEADSISVENRARRKLGGKEREFWGDLDVSELLTDGDFISPRKRPKLIRR